MLGQIISKMAGVHHADVVIDMPAQQGFGAAMARPTATVNIVMQSDSRRGETPGRGGRRAGQWRGLRVTPRDVTIIDANLGRQFTVKNADEMGGSEAMELVQAAGAVRPRQDRQPAELYPRGDHRHQRGMEPILKRTSEAVGYEKSEPLLKEESDDRDRHSPRGRGVPGGALQRGPDHRERGR